MLENNNLINIYGGSVNYFNVMKDFFRIIRIGIKYIRVKYFN